MNNGWICLHRKILNWEWWGNDNTLRTFLTLLLLANHEDTKWEGMIIGKGQLITSLNSLETTTKLTKKEIRTAIKHLEKTNEIIVKRAHRYSIITVCNYDSYQECCETNGHTEGTLRAQQGHTKGTLRAYNNNENKYNNNIYIDISSNFDQNEDCNEQKKSSSVVVSDDVKTIVERWNEIFKDTNIPVVRSTLNDSRKKKVKLRIKEYGLENIIHAMTVAKMSPFLNGESGRWKMTFDWMFTNENNITKILEGNYSEKNESLPLFQTPNFESDGLTEHLNALTAKYTVKGKDGDMYANEYDAEMEQNSLSSAIEIETARYKKNMLSQK